jgi:hypothetical protein
MSTSLSYIDLRKQVSETTDRRFSAKVLPVSSINMREGVHSFSIQSFG